jgi:cytochrome c-type biogenesis protein CcmH/NrfF
MVNQDIQETLTCPCAARDNVERTLAAASCDCPEATQDRAVVAELLASEAPRDFASGKAKLNVLTRLVQVDGTYDARLRYSRATYHQILETTKTTCPGERGLVLSQSQLSCTVRNRWLPRFRLMLASGMSSESIFEFYVDENNVTMAPELPWTYEDLKAAADKPLSWALPAAALFLFIIALFVYAIRQTRANRLLRAGALKTPENHLTERERLILEDELDLLDAGS